MEVEQYKLKEAISSHDTLFGKGYVCTGGEHRISNLIAPYQILPEMNLLDIGCGKGAATLKIAKEFNVFIDAVDSSEDFITEAKESCKSRNLSNKVNFHNFDILNFSTSKKYDLIFSIDTFLHIHNKHSLFSLIYSLLNQDGHLVFEDYCIDHKSEAMDNYSKEFGYDIMEASTYCKIIESSGFNVNVIDLSTYFYDFSKSELQKAKEFGFTWWENILSQRIRRIENGQHLLKRFCCTKN